jgi:hypothetical protein
MRYFHFLVSRLFSRGVTEKLFQDLLPSVFIAMLVRNKAHVLPFTLAYLESQDYPKDRISIWIRFERAFKGFEN